MSLVHERAAAAVGQQNAIAGGQGNRAGEIKLQHVGVSQSVIGGASALGGDHGGAQRPLGRALDAEGRALEGLLETLQNQAGDAIGGFAGTRARNPKRSSASKRR